MPFALIFIGVLTIVVGARGTYAQFGQLLASEFTGTNNFVYWFLAIFGVGALGYVDSLRTISRLLLVMVLLVLILANKGFFNQFKTALQQGPKTPNALPQQSSAPSNPAGQGYVSSQPQLNLGALGNINVQVSPGSIADKVFKFFGGTTQ